MSMSNLFSHSSSHSSRIFIRQRRRRSKLFSQQCPEEKRRRYKRFDLFLDYCCGGKDQFTNFIKGYLSQRSMRNQRNALITQLFDGEEVSLFRRLVSWCGNQYRQERNKAAKPTFLKVLLPVLKTRNDFLKYGFGSLHPSSLQRAKQSFDGTGRSILPNRGGRPSIDKNALRKELVNYMAKGTIEEQRISRPAANKGYVDRLNKRFMPCWILNFSKRQILSRFRAVNERARRVSRALLYSIFPKKQFKYGRSKTDLCSYCHYGKRYVARLCKHNQITTQQMVQRNVGSTTTSQTNAAQLNRHNEGSRTNYHSQVPTLDQKITYLLSNQSLIKHRPDSYIERLTYLKEHRARVKAQRSSFKDQVSNLSEKDLLIVLDFKQNIKLGGGNAQVSQSFYNTPSTTCLGMVLYFRDKNERSGNNKNGVIRKIYVEFISDCLTHNFLFVKYCLRRLLKSPLLGQILPQFASSSSSYRFNNLHFWSDCARHFRNVEFPAFLKEVKTMAKLTSINYFGEQHGKNACDQRFSAISKAYTIYCGRPGSAPLNTMQDFVNMLQSSKYTKNNSHQVIVLKREVVESVKERAKVLFVKPISGYHCIKYTNSTYFCYRLTSSQKCIEEVSDNNIVVRGVESITIFKSEKRILDPTEDERRVWISLEKISKLKSTSKRSVHQPRTSNRGLKRKRNVLDHYPARTQDNKRRKRKDTGNRKAVDTPGVLKNSENNHSFVSVVGLRKKRKSKSTHQDLIFQLRSQIREKEQKLKDVEANRNHLRCRFESKSHLLWMANNKLKKLRQKIRSMSQLQQQERSKDPIEQQQEHRPLSSQQQQQQQPPLPRPLQKKNKKRRRTLLNYYPERTMDNKRRKLK